VGIGVFINESGHLKVAREQTQAAQAEARDTRVELGRAQQTVSTLQVKNSALGARIRDASQELTSLRDQISSSVGDLNNPRFVLWNSCGADTDGCPLKPGFEYVGGVPDTFTYYVNFRATVPVTVRIMSTEDFVCRESGACSANSVGWDDQTSLANGVFHDAEGCAGYLAVFTSDEHGTLYPDIRITRNPAPAPTGTCR
jgi:hypothetical protein